MDDSFAQIFYFARESDFHVWLCHAVVASFSFIRRVSEKLFRREMEPEEEAFGKYTVILNIKIPD